MKTLLIDNYDSYTYNLFQLIAEVNGEEPTVVLNDASADALPDLRAFDNVVVSPGPGHPERPRDFGIGARVLVESTLPVLGVCLGFQGIAAGERARVTVARQPRHGHLSRIRHDGEDLFRGLPQDFTAVRYHSLSVREPLLASLKGTAWAEDGVLMGLRHRTRPLWGVQFHPESVLTEFGHRLFLNFRSLTAARPRPVRPARSRVPRSRSGNLRADSLHTGSDASTVFVPRRRAPQRGGRRGPGPSAAAAPDRTSEAAGGGGPRPRTAVVRGLAGACSLRARTRLTGECRPEVLITRTRRG